MCLMLTTTNTMAAPTATKNTTASIESLSSLPSALPTEKMTAAAAVVNRTELKTSLLHQLSQQNSASHSRLRKRHSKRQSNNFDGFDMDVNSSKLEWDNPCNGFFDPNAVPQQKTDRTATLKKLENVVSYQFSDMFLNGPNFIDIHRFKSWSLYEGRYKFLPKLKNKSKIALKRWYSNMQTYTATFAYLWRMQQKSLRSKTDTQVANELKSLLLSSRVVLCELEVAINKTHPNHRIRNHLPHVSREKMNSRLKLITRQMAMQYPNVDREVNAVDLKFSKIYFKRFLRKMSKSIIKFLEKPKPKTFNKKRTTTKKTNQNFNEIVKRMNVKRLQQQKVSVKA